ncbi:MAG: discoidin domain-containing protein [Verrucomicrobiae bacterium]|nr:discoidin domain-containing protein [Verrucomicrobiae bacterium]
MRISVVRTAALWMAPLALTLNMAVAADEEKVPLESKPPKPQFQGTPTNIKLPNLEKPITGKRPAFLIPKGCTNLAFKRPVTSSDQFPVVGSLDQVTDGDKEAVDGSFVELGPGKQWVQIDLGKKCKIYAIMMWLYHMQPRVYHDVVIQVSNDKDFITDVQTIYNNDHDNSSGFGVGKDLAYIEVYDGRIIDGKGVTGRYVRINTNGNTANQMNHFTEVEVWGKPAE